MNQIYRTGTPVGFLNTSTQTPNPANMVPQQYPAGFSGPPSYMGSMGPPSQPFSGPPTPINPPNYPALPPSAGNLPFPGQSMNPSSALSAANPSSSGLSGLLQSLTGGAGNLNIGSIIANVQKMAGVVNQAGKVMKNLGPMLQLLSASNPDQSSDDDLFSLDSGSSSKKKKKRRRKIRKKPTRKSRANSLKNRKKSKRFNRSSINKRR